MLRVQTYKVFVFPVIYSGGSPKSDGPRLTDSALLASNLPNPLAHTYTYALQFMPTMTETCIKKSATEYRSLDPVPPATSGESAVWHATPAACASLGMLTHYRVAWRSWQMQGIAPFLLILHVT